MSSALAAIFILLALAIGWWLGRRSGNESRPGQAAGLRERIHSLHNALDRHSDDALESLSQGLALNPETLESHVHVGSLFRRRGDIEKAIQIHQGLLEQAGTDPALVAKLHLELARDYIAGGLLGRAEQLLDELVRQGDRPISFEALDELRRIREREKDWSQAIKLAVPLLESRPQLRSSLANYYCELAQQKARNGDGSAMSELLGEALRVDRLCVRALLMRLDGELWRKDVLAAAATLRELLRQADGYIGEIVGILESRGALDEPEILAIFRELAAAPDAAPALLVVLASLDGENAQRWRERLLDQVRRQPSWQGMIDCLDVSEAEVGDTATLLGVRSIIADLHKRAPRYRCDSCGFFGRQLHWQCPGCHTWNTLRPVATPW
ncbi:tetratricopeptide repeat protein [compost metagenome]